MSAIGRFGDKTLHATQGFVVLMEVAFRGNRERI